MLYIAVSIQMPNAKIIVVLYNKHCFEQNDLVRFVSDFKSKVFVSYNTVLLMSHEASQKIITVPKVI